MNKMTFIKIILATMLSLGTISFFHSSVSADETQDLKNQVKALQEKVDQLEKQNASKGMINHAPTDSSNTIFEDQWDPFADMRLMQRQMNQMMKEQMIDFNPKQDIKQTPDQYIISMDLPGMDKDKINVQVKSGALIVSGERNSEVKEEKPNQFYRQERSFGHFYKTMPLPGDAKSENIDAQYANGVLTVKIPREKSGSKSAQGQKIIVK